MPETIVTKRCPKCNSAKPVAEFYRNKSNADGYNGWCKVCHNARAAEYAKSPRGRETQYRANHTERAKESRHRYKKSTKGRESARRERQTDAYKEREKEYRGRKEYREYMRQYRMAHPEGRHARNLIWNEIRQGRIPKASTLTCSCGKPAAHYHHPRGYDDAHALDVVPLCHGCHMRLHLHIPGDDTHLSK